MICSKCKQDKPETEFGQRRNRHYELIRRGVCKVCIYAYTNHYRQAHPKCRKVRRNCQKVTVSPELLAIAYRIAIEKASYRKLSLKEMENQINERQI